MSSKKDIWRSLSAHQKKMQDIRMGDLFSKDSARAEKFTLSYDALTLDYSKNRITEETRDLLLELLEASGFQEKRAAMFAGERINTTENRAVLHTALRNVAERPVLLDDEDVMPEVIAVWEQMQAFEEAINSGDWTGFSGKRMTDIVNIGIGGSVLGSDMVIDALKDFHTGKLRCHFVTNVDATEINDVMQSLNPETTLFLVASKSFTTQETMANARTARNWLVSHYNGKEEAVADHFVALSTNEDAVKEFGIDTDNMFPFRDWVGGRYSSWSSIGLVTCLMIGFDNFKSLLEGAYMADMHFLKADPAENIPVMLALVGIWYRNFWDAPCYSVVPYFSRLKKLPLWLQQVDMESNGKYVTAAGKIVDTATGPIVFGYPGTDAQHSYFQLMHQGTDMIPADFIGILKPAHTVRAQHDMLMANMLAQAEALMLGQESPNDPARYFPGNRPTNTMLLEKLTPYTLGLLMAVYEHKIFVQGMVWEINSFDQFGVELGKVLADRILGEVAADAAGAHDSSTMELFARCFKKS
ncbi:MAG: glucose-6-phosphate isomerase [Alphaproteobacteria bacterium]|nr:MAG: glucose-6-phosphate isomerase [Alphaproteobacteria bacterium]